MDHRREAGIPVLQPADHDPSAIGGEKGLGGVKVNAIVNGLVALLNKCMVVFIIGADDADGPVSVVILESLGQHILGAYEQDMLSVQFKEIRAFPHFTITSPVGAQDLLEFPVKSVRALKQ